MDISDLDERTPDELMAFWTKHQRGRRYQELFPERSPRTLRATADLAN